MEQAGSLDLTGFANRDAADQSFAGDLVEFRSRKTSEVFRPRFRGSNPNGEEPLAIGEEVPETFLKVGSGFTSNMMALRCGAS